MDCNLSLCLETKLQIHTENLLCQFSAWSELLALHCKFLSTLTIFLGPFLFQSTCFILRITGALGLTIGGLFCILDH